MNDLANSMASQFMPGELPSATNRKSFVMLELLNRWCWLHMPAELVVAICRAAVRDALQLGSKVHPEVEMIANFDEDSPLKYQDKLSQMYKRETMPEPYRLEVNVVDKSGEKPKTVQKEYPFILPSDMYGCLYKHHRHQFNRRVLGGEGRLAEFWSNVDVSTDERFERHPVRGVEAFEKRAVALRVHGDGVPIDARKNIQLMSSTLQASWDMVPQWKCETCFLRYQRASSSKKDLVNNVLNTKCGTSLFGI